MNIDLHIHSKSCSDGKLSIEDIFLEAKKRDMDMISITDHDSMNCQKQAISLAEKHGIKYITGMELNITFSHPEITAGKNIPLDFLAYHYDFENAALKTKLAALRRHREERALKIMENINAEFESEGIEKLTESDMKAIEDSVDGAFGRPHIANYLVSRGIVNHKQEAFDKYLVKCDVPKYPLRIEEASKLVREAGGIMIFAHPNDPNGTSLVKITDSLEEQTEIIEKVFLPYIDGVECWHTRHTEKTTVHYIEFAKKHELIMTGGSDCHQTPVLIGTVDVPDFAAEQFSKLFERS